MNDGSSDHFQVRSDECQEMFSLFVNAILAGEVVTRVGPQADLLAISPKLIPFLLYLNEHHGEPMTVGKLAEAKGVSLGWASRVTDKLAGAKLLDRIRDEHDRRVVRLQLTERGNVVSAEVWSDREALVVRALSEIAPRERPAIARFLRRLAAELELHTLKATPHRS
jgi:DNA-binding MarR family transcriptional regulator